MNRNAFPGYAAEAAASGGAAFGGSALRPERHNAQPLFTAGFGQFPSGLRTVVDTPFFCADRHFEAECLLVYHNPDAFLDIAVAPQTG